MKANHKKKKVVLNFVSDAGSTFLFSNCGNKQKKKTKKK